MKRNRLSPLYFGAIVLLVGLIVQSALPQSASAGQIVSRSLTLVDNAGVGGSTPGGVVKHRFNFTVPTSGALGAIKFEYCTTPADVGSLTCITPTGLSTTGATLTAENSNANGFSINSAANGAPVITRASAGSIAANTQLSYELTGITNPSDPEPDPLLRKNNITFFVRITTYRESTMTTRVDDGSVAASTAEPIVLSGIMPESLVFCTGATIGLTASVPDCNTATSGSIAFDRLFSPTDTALATSQMAASTNAGSGYAITVSGPTLTSGSNTITAIGGTADVSKRGTAQFGMNLVSNTTPLFGTEVAPVSNGTNYRARAMNGYATADNFKFNGMVTPDIVAQSDYVDGTATLLGASDAQIYTVGYMVNVPGSQPAGTYTSTLTYICTPTF